MSWIEETAWRRFFRDDGGREMFLKTLGELCGRCGCVVHGYVLMGNHYLLLLETPEANLSRGMRLLQGIYTEEFRRMLLEKMKSPESSAHTNCGQAIRKSHDEQEAVRLLTTGLAQLGIGTEDLRNLPKGSAQKIALAAAIKKRTSVTNAWERLNMEAASRVSRNCGQAAGRADVTKLIE